MQIVASSLNGPIKYRIKRGTKVEFIKLSPDGLSREPQKRWFIKFVAQGRKEPRLLPVRQILSIEGGANAILRTLNMPS